MKHESTIHIVHIIPSLAFGGAERFLVDLVNTSDAARYRHTIITFSEANPLQRDIGRADVRIVIVPKRGKMSLRLVYDLVRALQKVHPDIVHTHLFGGDFWGRLAARILKLPVVTTEHNVNMDEGRVKTRIKRYLGQYSQWYVACSEAVKHDMAKRYGIALSRISVIHYGIDLSRFSLATKKECSAVPQLLSIGRLTRQKGHDILLGALQNLTHLSWHLTIVGEGPEKLALQTLVTQYQLADRVTILPPTMDVPTLLAQADFFLLPSRWEGLGIVVMEAMCAGVPVVASRVDGVPELVLDGETGFLVFAAPEAWQEKISWCLSHPEESRRATAQARLYARAYFGREKTMAGYEAVYARVLSHRQKAF